MLAKPFKRHGRRGARSRLAAPAELAPALAAAIASLRAEDYQNIAVIAKGPDAVRRAGSALPSAGAAGVPTRQPARQAYPGGLLVLPVHLAKGMEFEAVLLAGADEASYPSAEFEGRLLYVAVTRALHALEIYAVGAPERAAGAGRRPGLIYRISLSCSEKIEYGSR